MSFGQRSPRVHVFMAKSALFRFDEDTKTRLPLDSCRDAVTNSPMFYFYSHPRHAIFVTFWSSSPVIMTRYSYTSRIALANHLLMMTFLTFDTSTWPYILIPGCNTILEAIRKYFTLANKVYVDESLLQNGRFVFDETKV